MLLNPAVNSVLIFLLTAFDSADGTGFPATLCTQKEGSGSLILLVPWQKRKRAGGSPWRFPLLQPGRQASPHLSLARTNLLCAQEEEIQWDLVNKKHALDSVTFQGVHV